LVRVDIFQNENQELVVNEFESLDANYYTNEGTMIKDCIASEFLNFYWMQKVELSITKFEEEKENIVVD
jgi:hypothetical protein